MSEDLDDEYDDFDDDSVFGEESEDDLYEEDDDLDEEYDEELSSCFVCNQPAENVPVEGRWRFAVSDEDDGESTEFWACRSCREKFASLEEFDEFRKDWTRCRLYRCSATLQRLILLKAPDSIIANAAFLVAGILFSADSSLEGHGMRELNRLVDRVGK